MKDLFVSFEEAVKLKELGFDEPCFFYYNEAGESMCHAPILETNSSYKHNEISQVLYSQAFEWFRIKHNISSYIRADWQPDWNAYSYQCYFNQDKEQFNLIKYYNTYEEAQLKCLQELIKMISI